MKTLSLLGLVDVAREWGDLAGAAATLRTVETFVARHLPAADPARSAALFEAALLHLAGLSFAEAKKELEDALAGHTGAKVLGASHVRALVALAQTELGLGHIDPRGGSGGGGERLRGKARRGGQAVLLGRVRPARAGRDRAASARRPARRSSQQLSATVGRDHTLTRKAVAIAGG